MKSLAFVFIGFITGCVATTPVPEKRTYIASPPEILVTVRHLDHEQPYSYLFESHDPNAPCVTPQRFEVTAPDEFKGRTFSIKILYGYEAPLQTSEYFRLRIPRYLVEGDESRKQVGDHYQLIGAWNFAALVVDEPKEMKKEPNQTSEPTAPSGRGSP